MTLVLPVTLIFASDLSDSVTSVTFVIYTWHDCSMNVYFNPAYGWRNRTHDKPSSLVVGVNEGMLILIYSTLFTISGREKKFNAYNQI